jgi:DNA polymerase III epsilon subunit-like protein
VIKRTFATNSNNKNNNKLKTNGNRARKNINVGQGEAQDTRLVKSQGLNPAQQKSAQVQLQSMEQSTSRILHMTPEQIQLHLSNDSSTSIGVALVNEMRVAIHFWSNKWVSALDEQTQRYPSI